MRIYEATPYVIYLMTTWNTCEGSEGWLKGGGGVRTEGQGGDKWTR